MARLLARLPCGVIYTQDFADYLARIQTDQAVSYPGKILTLEYIRAASGPSQGAAWWQTSWQRTAATPEHHRFKIGETWVCIPRPTQLGLRDRCLDYQEGAVTVIP